MKVISEYDIILADGGFDIGNSVGLYHAKVKLPAFTKVKKYLSPMDVERSRQLHARF